MKITKSQLREVIREQVKQIREGREELPQKTNIVMRVGNADMDELDEKITELFGQEGSDALRELIWEGDGEVSSFTFISRAFKLCASGQYSPYLLANLLAEFMKLSGIRIEESPLEGPVAGHDYKNPRTPKDVEDLEAKGYSKIDKRTPSFKYKDNKGEYTPMMKKLEEDENSYYQKMAYHNSGALSDFIVPGSVNVKDLDDSYRLYFELKVPVSFGYDADEIKSELGGESYGGPGASYSHAKTLIKRMGDHFHVRVWVTGGMDV